MKDEHRQRGVIVTARTGLDEDRGFRTTWVGVDFGGSRQGFGDYILQEHAETWNAELCTVFDVLCVEELVGRACWVLRAFSGWGEEIEGLESMDGRRFVATDFFRRHLNQPVKSVLVKRREEIQTAIASATRRINEDVRKLADLESDYVDWTTFNGPMVTS